MPETDVCASVEVRGRAPFLRAMSVRGVQEEGCKVQGDRGGERTQRGSGCMAVTASRIRLMSIYHVNAMRSFLISKIAQQFFAVL